eukprot:7138-Heterococcus_DN1.PRE.1
MKAAAAASSSGSSCEVTDYSIMQLFALAVAVQYSTEQQAFMITVMRRLSGRTSTSAGQAAAVVAAVFTLFVVRRDAAREYRTRTKHSHPFVFICTYILTMAQRAICLCIAVTAVIMARLSAVRRSCTVSLRSSKRWHRRASFPTATIDLAS